MIKFTSDSPPRKFEKKTQSSNKDFPGFSLLQEPRLLKPAMTNSQRLLKERGLDLFNQLESSSEVSSGRGSGGWVPSDVQCINALNFLPRSFYQFTEANRTTTRFIGGTIVQ